MTGEQLIDAALEEIATFTDRIPNARAPWLRRLTTRQAEIFAIAAEISPDYLGRCLTATVADPGTVDLSAAVLGIVPGVAPIERITLVEIADPGTSGYAVGAEVAIVPTGDTERSAEPPRVRLRSDALLGVGADLALVDSVKVHYVRRPAPIRTLADSAELVEPYVVLLVWDLAKTIMRRAGVGDAVRTAAVAVFEAEETALLDLFRAHVASFSPLHTRF